jgi:hypothetical protein
MTSWLVILPVLLAVLYPLRAGIEAVIARVYTSIRRRLLEDRISKIEIQVDERRIKLTGMSTETIERVWMELGLTDNVSAEDLRLAEYSIQRDQAEKEIAAYLPDNPRRAKRLINHERLYARIAEDRGIFGGSPELSHRHLAKWVLIIEAWPRLGAALTRDPSQMEALELTSDIQELQSALAFIGMQPTEQLFKVLHEGVRLSPILERLVRFDPAKPDSAEKSADFNDQRHSEVRERSGKHARDKGSPLAPSNVTPDTRLG